MLVFVAVVAVGRKAVAVALIVVVAVGLPVAWLWPSYFETNALPEKPLLRVNHERP